MNFDDFNNIDFNNAGSLPIPVKLVLLSILALVIVVGGILYYGAMKLMLLIKLS